MTTTADPTDDVPAKASKMPLIIGLVLALVGGGGGFMAVQLGFIGGSAGEEDAHGADPHAEEDDGHGEVSGPVAFVPLDPLVISLPSSSGPRFLRFSAQIEVAPEYESEVTSIKPRIVDVLNGYLRAVEVTELEDPTILVKLRGQMLRRIQVVSGQGRVKDLLIMEFVVN